MRHIFSLESTTWTAVCNSCAGDRGWFRAISTASRWQTVFETCYRWQVTKELVLTPDLQLVFGDDQAGNSKTRVVGGIRFGLVF